MAYLFSHAVPIRRPISLQAPSLALQVYTRLEKSKVSSNREPGLALPLFTGQSDPKAQRPFGLYPRVNPLDSPTGHLEDTSHPLTSSGALDIVPNGSHKWTRDDHGDGS